MTKQIKHKRTSKKGKVFGAGSIIPNNSTNNNFTEKISYLKARALRDVKYRIKKREHYVNAIEITLNKLKIPEGGKNFFRNYITDNIAISNAEYYKPKK